jgi:Mlc titration factor MtfA (ptsG expression regulator)
MIYSVFGTVFLAAGMWWLRRRWRQRRRALLRGHPIPDPWADILKQRVPLYERLPADLKQRLHGLIQVFLDEKRFFGRGGLAVTEIMRVTIAAQACLLILNRNGGFYPGFSTIMIYPDTYVAQESKSDGMISSTHRSVRSGESWFRGPVILSWRDTLAGTARPDDGHNVVLHEFAHKLDEEDGRMDGLPLLDEAAQYRTWATVLSDEFDSLREAVGTRHKTVMDEYGATSAPEFFAVATETFFEKPLAMKKKHPALYAELQQFYRLDPAGW